MQEPVRVGAKLRKFSGVITYNNLTFSLSNLLNFLNAFANTHFTCFASVISVRMFRLVCGVMLDDSEWR